MKRNEQIKELSLKVVSIIQDFFDEAEEFNGKFLKNVQASEDFKNIILTNNNNISIEYCLSEVGYIFLDNIQNFWYDRDRFLSYLKTEELNFYTSYRDLDRNTFIEHSGKILYIKEKYTEMLEKLYDIGLETKSL